MRTALLLILLAISLAGCGPKLVTMKPLNEFPQPLVEPLPLRVGVYFPPEFASFTHQEKRPGPSGQEWTINLGAPQLQVFRAIFAATFASVSELETPGGGNGGITAIIVPSGQDFQFALPDDTRAKVFEIWGKYDLSIRDPEGEEIGRWAFTAYGKTPTAFLKTDEEAIQAATLIALRDAGASIITGLQRDQRIREWLGVP